MSGALPTIDKKKIQALIAQCVAYEVQTKDEAVIYKAADTMQLLLTEVDRLNQWADSFSDAHLKERQTGDALVKELQSEVDRLNAKDMMLAKWGDKAELLQRLYNAGIEQEREIVDLKNRLEEMEARKDGAYTERNRLVSLLSKVFPSGKKRTAIEGWSEDWHGCVYIDLPTGQASWHHHDSQGGLFEHLPEYLGEWDGHTTEEKYDRISNYTPSMLDDHGIHAWKDGYDCGRRGGINAPELHHNTAGLVIRFTDALRKKLADAEEKYGYADGWMDANWMDECRTQLMKHIEKGDPRDVAAYCAFLWHHGASTAQPDELKQQQPTSTDVRNALLFALWHHQGAHSLIGQPIRKALGIGAHADLTKDQTSAAMRVQTALFAQDIADEDNNRTTPATGEILQLDGGTKL